MKLKKLTLALMLSSALVGCANIDESLNKTSADFQQYQDITNKYHIQPNWWALYNDAQLNRLVDQALSNNKDLALAAISVNSALYKANLLGANLVPSFNGSTSSSASKNIKEGGSSIISHSGSLSVSYTLDLWRRLADSADAGEWAYKSTEETMEATRQTLINSIVTTYYQLAYLNDAITAIQDSIKNYEKINSVMQSRFQQGITDRASSDQATQSVLTARNTLITYQNSKKTAEKTLRNLLNLKPNETLNISYPHILNVSLPGVNMNVPFSAIANRPDVKAAQYKLMSAFKDAKATQKSWFPQITLGGSLGSSGNKVDNALNTPIGVGTLGISLPFLDWNSVRWNVKISEAAYDTARLNFEQSITTALNDIDSNYYAFEQSQTTLANLQERYKYDKRVTQYYKNRYDAGVSELREWLVALNNENTSQIEILNAKYATIQNENAIYASMAGYYSQK